MKMLNKLDKKGMKTGLTIFLAVFFALIVLAVAYMFTNSDGTKAGQASGFNEGSKDLGQNIQATCELGTAITYTPSCVESFNTDSAVTGTYLWKKKGQIGTGTEVACGTGISVAGGTDIDLLFNASGHQGFVVSRKVAACEPAQTEVFQFLNYSQPTVQIVADDSTAVSATGNQRALGANDGADFAVKYQAKLNKGAADNIVCVEYSSTDLPTVNLGLPDLPSNLKLPTIAYYNTTYDARTCGYLGDLIGDPVTGAEKTKEFSLSVESGSTDPTHDFVIRRLNAEVFVNGKTGAYGYNIANENNAYVGDDYSYGITTSVAWVS